MFRDISMKLFEFHRTIKDDILYCESDVVCGNKIELAGGDRVRMFNIACSGHYLDGEGIQLNSGIIYIPKNAKLQEIDSWPDDKCPKYGKNGKERDWEIWDTFQRFWNDVFWDGIGESQGMTTADERYNFLKQFIIIRGTRGFLEKSSKDNFIKIKPVLYHINSSRGYKECLSSMENILKEDNYENHWDMLPFLT